jgi:hypothetical protein
MAQAPYVVNALPAANAQAVSPLTDVSLLFSSPLQPTAANQLVVHSARAGGKQAGTGALTSAQLTWRPTFDFLPGEQVWVTAPSSMLSSTGTALRPYVQRFTVASRGATGTFTTSADLVVGNGPACVAVADIDSDGDLDMLAANISSNSVSVRFNDGTGVYSSGPTLSVGQQPFWITTADVDNDGDLDVLTADYGTNGVSVCLNAGNGSFGAATRFGVGGYPREVVTADFDGDGDLDFATANSAVDNSLSLGFNNGAGSFNTGTLPVFVGLRPYSLAAADVDGDGDVDLLSSNHDGHTVSVRLNDGQGDFAGGSEVPVGNSPYGMATADVDGDGDLDLLVASQGTSTVSVRLNDGQGHFSGGSNPAVALAAVYLTVADVDGDGDPDLLTTAGYLQSTASVYVNNGQGTFTAASSFSVGANPAGIVAADINGDGALDVLTANVNNIGTTGTISVRLNQAAPAVNTFTGVTPAQGLAGALVTLTGSDFTGATAVSFQGARAPVGSFTVLSTTSLQVVVPSQARTGLVRVQTPRGVLTSTTPFTRGTITAMSSALATATLLVYPNPAHDYLTLAGVTAEATVRLLDAQGRVIWTQQGGTELVLKTLPSGLYALQVLTAGQLVTRRFVRE